MDLEQEMDDRGGLISIPDLADLIEVDPRALREYAEETDVAIVGRAYVFTTEQALDAEDELCGEPEEEDGDEEEEEDEDGCVTVNCNE